MFETSMAKLTSWQSRSISPENPTGGKGMGGRAASGLFADAAKELGVGWKLSPAIEIAPGATAVLGEIDGAGILRQIWMTGYNQIWRLCILRFYWDGCAVPSVECPVGDFFACAETEKLPNYASLLTCLSPKNALSCYWEMPFRTHCRITLENLGDKTMMLFYQINYVLGPVPADMGYFHARFRRVNPVPYREVYTIVNNVEGKGQYVGTYLYWTVHADGWWGEGEVKFYLDGDREYPTICGTGTEDYFCGGDGFFTPDTLRYENYATPYCGFFATHSSECLRPQQRFSMYRWHVTDPIYFSENLRVTVQDLGWKSFDHSLGYEALQDDISSVAYWYQDKPAAYREPLPEKNRLRIV